MNNSNHQELKSDEPLLLNINEAGRKLGLSKWSMYSIMQAGELRSVKIGARRLIARGDLDSYVESLRSRAEVRHGF